MRQGPDREFWDIARPEREPSQSRLFLVGVVLAVVISTPWYLPAESAGRPILGLPLWVWLALAGAVLLASCTSWAALFVWRDTNVAPTSSSRSSVEDD